MSAAARTLLVADDSVTIQKVVDLTFRDEGFAVTTVSNGTAAIEIIERTKPDIVLLDAQMPKPDGYEVCRRIKRDEKLRHIPVLLLINSFEPYNEAEARRAGANDTLTKPFQSIRELVNKVSGLLSSARPSDEAAETESTHAADEHRTREDSRATEAAAPPLAAQGFEPESIAASADKDDRRQHHADETPPITDDAILSTRSRDMQEEAQIFTTTAAEEQADDDEMIQVAELSAPHSSTVPSSSSAPTFRSNDDEFKMLEPPTEETSPLDEPLNFDAPLSPAPSESNEADTVHDTSTVHDTYSDDDLLHLDISIPANYMNRLSNDEAVNLEYTAAERESDTAMTPQDEPYHSSNDLSDKPQVDNPFGDNLFDDEPQAANKAASEDDFPLALADDAPLELGEIQAAPLNNFDDSILDFGDAAAVVPTNTNEQYAPAMIDREGFEFADDVEVTNIEAADEAMKVEETVPDTHGTIGVRPAFSLNALPPEVIENIARQVVAHLSENVLREVAWEVVPQLAERLIKQRLDEDAKSGE